MSKNRLSRIIRVVIGVVLIGLTLTHQIGGWGWLGVLPLVSGLLGICPACSLGSCAAGDNQCSMKK